MKKIILIVFILSLFFAGAAHALFDDSTAKNAQTAAKASADTNTKVTGLQKTIQDFFSDAGKGIIAGAFAVFVYITAFITKIFYMLFAKTGEVLPRLIDFTQTSFWPHPYDTAFNHGIALFYVAAMGFTLIAVLSSVMQKISSGQNPARAVSDLSFAILALAFFPFIYKTIFTLMGLFSNALFSVYNSSPSKDNIFNALINVSTYFSKTAADPTMPKILGGNFTEQSIMDLDSVITICKDNLTKGNAVFFINQAMIFVVCLTGVVACLEAILLKGAQLLNIFIAYFTGIFACGTLSNPALAKTFFQWILKFVQLLSYNIFWALLLLIINMLGAKLVSNSSNPDQILYLIMILAALRTLPKVGGIAEGLLLSGRVMENFTQQAKQDVIGAGVLATTAISAAQPFTNMMQQHGTNIVKGAGIMVKNLAHNVANAGNSSEQRNLLQKSSSASTSQSGNARQSRMQNSAPRTSGSGQGGSSGPVSGKTREQWQQTQRAKRKP
jgi:hypothetical protein